MDNRPKSRTIRDQEKQPVARRAAPDRATQMTPDEQLAAERRQLFFDLKVRGSLETYYQLYPHERPKSRDADRGRTREDKDRGR